MLYMILIKIKYFVKSVCICTSDEAFRPFGICYRHKTALPIGWLVFFLDISVIKFGMISSYSIVHCSNAKIQRIKRTVGNFFKQSIQWHVFEIIAYDICVLLSVLLAPCPAGALCCPLSCCLSRCFTPIYPGVPDIFAELKIPTHSIEHEAEQRGEHSMEYGDCIHPGHLRLFQVHESSNYKERWR